ncbi:MAG: hypothetical protein ABEH78_05315 [Haloferacaceae archaeon]
MDLRTNSRSCSWRFTLVLSLATYGGLETYKQQEIERTRADGEETASLAAGQLEPDSTSTGTTSRSWPSAPTEGPGTTCRPHSTNG